MGTCLLTLNSLFGDKVCFCTSSPWHILLAWISLCFSSISLSFNPVFSSHFSTFTIAAFNFNCISAFNCSIGSCIWSWLVVGTTVVLNNSSLYSSRASDSNKSSPTRTSTISFLIHVFS